MPSKGFTLVELMVVIAIIAITASLSSVALGSLRATPPRPRVAKLEQGRDSALRIGTPVSVELEQETVLFLPDGRALGTGLDPWTGGPYKGGHDAH